MEDRVVDQDLDTEVTKDCDDEHCLESNGNKQGGKSRVECKCGLDVVSQSTGGCGNVQRGGDNANEI